MPFLKTNVDRSLTSGTIIVVHLGQAIRYRAWWLLFTVVLAGVGEMIGWGGRLWSTFQPLAENPYMMQYVPTISVVVYPLTPAPGRIVCTIVAPTPLIGAIFISFGRLSSRLGQQYSRLSARLCK